jgi:hypothetical protein
MRPIAEVASRFVLLVPFVLLSFDVTGAADNSEKQAKALNLIIDFTNSICETVKQEGTSRDVELSGEVKAELNWLLKRLANLGSKAAVRYQDSTYQGVLQEQLAGQLNKIRDCKKELALVLQARLLPEAQKPELPKPPDITPSDRSERQLALIRPEPWAARLIGSWKADDLYSNIPDAIVYTFNPDGSFLSIEQPYDHKARGRFQYRRGHVFIEWNNWVDEYAELIMMENQFRYRIVDHTDPRAIGREYIFRRLRR